MAAKVPPGKDMEVLTLEKTDKPFVLRVKVTKPEPKPTKVKVSGYAFFVKMCRREHRKKNPNVPVNMVEFIKKCSRRWKMLSPRDKCTFRDLAEMAQARSGQEVKPDDLVHLKSDPNAPKKPLSAFFLFASEFRPKIKSAYPGITVGNLSKKLGEIWARFSDIEKQPYKEKAEGLKKQYLTDLAEYNARVKAAEKSPLKVREGKVQEKKEEPRDSDISSDSSDHSSDSSDGSSSSSSGDSSGNSSSDSSDSSSDDSGDSSSDGSSDDSDEPTDNSDDSDSGEDDDSNSDDDSDSEEDADPKEEGEEEKKKGNEEAKDK